MNSEVLKTTPEKRNHESSIRHLEKMIALFGNIHSKMSEQKNRRSFACRGKNK